MSKYIDTRYMVQEEASNSCPILFDCVDNNLYYVKIAHSENNFDDLIYESLAVHLAKYFKIPTPNYSIINIIPNSFNIEELKSLENKSYINKNSIAFGSHNITNHDILGPHNDLIPDKRAYNNLINPLDFILIGIFDFHLTNTDRSFENYNIIFDLSFTKGKKKFIAIDHVAIFGGVTLKNKFEPHCKNNLGINILNCDYARKLIYYIKKDHGVSVFFDIIDDYFEKIDLVPQIVKKYFKTVPREWQYDEELPNRIIDYLKNEDRNVHLQEELFKFLNIRR